MFRSKDSMPGEYRLVDSGIDPEELYNLYRDVDGFDGDADSVILGEDWESTLASAQAALGARGRRGRLVGAGFLEGNTDYAELIDLAVLPEHRHQGIGRVLVRQRVEIAKDIGVKSIGTRLSHTNTLGPLYRELGFMPTIASTVLEMDLPDNFFKDFGGFLNT